MANKIHAIKFLNWLFLRIKPSDYDPTQPLEFEGGIGGGTSLPDQTGNAGKFLQTNGTDIVWSDVLKISNDILIGSNTLVIFNFLFFHTILCVLPLYTLSISLPFICKFGGILSPKCNLVLIINTPH